MVKRMRTMTSVKQIVRVASVLAVLAVVPGADVLAAAPQPAPEVVMSRGAGGRVFVEVAEPGVTVRKELGPGTSLVTITTPKDELQIRVAGRQMTVSTPGGTATIATGRTEEVGQLLAVLQRSDAAARGLALLKRVPFDGRHVGQQTLLMTRAVLEVSSGFSPAMAMHRDWALRERERLQSTRAARPVIVKAGLAAADQNPNGPGECWDKYAEEAARVADDFVQCTSGLKWYNVIDWTGCFLLYTVRAEGAVLWYVNCLGGVPFVS